MHSGSSKSSYSTGMARVGAIAQANSYQAAFSISIDFPMFLSLGDGKITLECEARKTNPEFL